MGASCLSAPRAPVRHTTRPDGDSTTPRSFTLTLVGAEVRPTWVEYIPFPDGRKLFVGSSGTGAPYDPTRR